MKEPLARAGQRLSERAGETARLALSLIEGRRHEPGSAPGLLRRVARRLRGLARRSPARMVRSGPLAVLDARIAASRGAIVFPPTIGWNVHLVQRPHHLARAFARAGYVAVARRVRARLRHAGRTAVLDGRPSPAETAAVLGGCDVVLGMRLHALVFALSAGVPAVALAYDPKVGATLREAGASEPVLALAALRAEPLAAALVRPMRGARR